MKKIIRTATAPQSLDLFCRGLLHELSAYYEVVALSSPGKELDRLGRREGVRTIAVSMHRRTAPWHDTLSLFRLARVFHKEKPFMVHSMTPKAGLLCMAAARMTGVPVRVHTFTGLLFPTAKGWRRKLFMLTDRITCACATHIIAEGTGVKNDLQRYNITRKRIQVLGYGNVRGINLHYYTRTPEVTAQASLIRQKLSIREGEFTFLFAGRLAGDKGINELVETFCRLRAVHPDTHLLLVGEEEERDLLKETTKNLITIVTAIHLVTWQSDVRPWFTAADALAFPSYREGVPNVVLEAGAMGLPSIVTDINGSREIIHNGVNGVVIPPHDVTALYEAMKRWVEHPSEAAQCGANAPALIASRYEQGYVWQCLKDFYRQILA